MDASCAPSYVQRCGRGERPGSGYSSVMTPSGPPKSFLQKHSLSLATLGVVVMLILLYRRADPSTHLGSFYGNAIADWSGVLVTVVMTKYLYERGSKESRQPQGK